jgi:hypothetical protein
MFTFLLLLALAGAIYFTYPVQTKSFLVSAKVFGILVWEWAAKKVSGK